MGLPVEVRVGG